MRGPSLPSASLPVPSCRAIPLQLLCITVSVGYRRQTASAVHHVVNVRRFLSYLSSLSLPFLSSLYFLSLSSILSRKRAYSSRVHLFHSSFFSGHLLHSLVLSSLFYDFPRFPPSYEWRHRIKLNLKFKLLLSRRNVALASNCVSTRNDFNQF